MNTSLLYQSLAKGEKETVFGYFLLRLLKGEEFFESDHKEVFVYLAGLLLKLLLPIHQSESQKYLILYETDLAKFLDERGKDLAERYYCLKFNADHLLVTCGLFHSHRDREHLSDVDRGKTYYRWAADAAHKIYRKETTLTQVFGHLSEYFEDYEERLRKLRRTYLQLVQKLTEKEKEDLLTQVNRSILS